ncbi:MAG: hypothetical protein ACTSUE_17400 [Promethearchaeota archaeon]
MAPNKCKSCGVNFTEKSKNEYNQAPAWDNECPKCTKLKFERFITEYIMVLLQTPQLIDGLNDFFKGVNLRVAISASDTDTVIKEKIIRVIYGIVSLKGSKLHSMNTGARIKTFVTFFESMEGLQTIRGKNPKLVRNIITSMVIAAICIVAGVLMVFL